MNSNENLTENFAHDIRWLYREHGIAFPLLQSLSASEKEAADMIALFRRMMFAINGSMITIAFIIIGYGIRAYVSNDSALSLTAVLFGVAILLYFTAVFTRQVRAVQAMNTFRTKWNDVLLSDMPRCDPAFADTL